ALEIEQLFAVRGAGENELLAPLAEGERSAVLEIQMEKERAAVSGRRRSAPVTAEQAGETHAVEAMGAHAEEVRQGGHDVQQARRAEPAAPRDPLWRVKDERDAHHLFIQGLSV